jgi:hypothetical protein
MNDLIETEARHQIHERLQRAAEPHARSLPAVPGPRRHRMAERLRRIADRIDN